LRQQATRVVTVIGANGNCTASATASVTIGTGISITVNNATICAGQTASLVASGASSYTWSSGANTNTLNVNPTTTTVYTISGTSGACSGINTVTVDVISSTYGVRFLYFYMFWFNSYINGKWRQ
jgi:hypothetical protein